MINRRYAYTGHQKCDDCNGTGTIFKETGMPFGTQTEGTPIDCEYCTAVGTLFRIVDDVTSEIEVLNIEEILNLPD